MIVTPTQSCKTEPLMSCSCHRGIPEFGFSRKSPLTTSIAVVRLKSVFGTVQPHPMQLSPEVNPG
jgi:hypothetical protein